MKKIGRYDIIAELGRGAMGIVYRASDPTIGREVALKVLSLNASTEEGTNSPQQMFMREVRAAGRLAHPSIVTIHDAFDDKEDQTSCIVMELVPGVTLEKILESGHPLGMERILSIIRQVAEGLDYAHRNQVIHRDLKPANILVTEDGRAKITDFGIAKVLAREGLARTVGIMGTPSFMSPEQVKGGDIDARTDIFSLGIIIFTMMAGRKPFLGNSAAVMFKIVYEEPPPPSTLNAQLTPAHDYLTKKCLAKDRNLRYSSAREFLDDLDDLQHSRPLRSQAGAPALVSPAPAFTSRRDQPPAVEAPIAIAPPPPPPMPPINSAAPTAFGEFPTLRTEPPPHSFEPAPRPVTPLPPPVAGPPKPVTTPPVPPAPAHGPLTPPSPGGTMVMNTPGFLAEEAPPPSPPVATRPPAPAPVQPPKPVAPPPIAPPPRAAAPVPPRPPLTPPDPRGTMVMQSPALISRAPQPPPPRVGATPPGGPPAAAQPPKPFAPPSAAPVPGTPPAYASGSERHNGHAEPGRRSRSVGTSASCGCRTARARTAAQARRVTPGHAACEVAAPDRTSAFGASARPYRGAARGSARAIQGARGFLTCRLWGNDDWQGDSYAPAAPRDASTTCSASGAGHSCRAASRCRTTNRYTRSAPSPRRGERRSAAGTWRPTGARAQVKSHSNPGGRCGRCSPCRSRVGFLGDSPGKNGIASAPPGRRTNAAATPAASHGCDFNGSSASAGCSCGRGAEAAGERSSRDRKETHRP